MKKRRNKRKLQKTCFFYKKYGKRLMDIILSFLGIIVLSPIMLITAFLVRMRLGSPVIFRQKRPGKNENIFEMYKFRTMTDTKDQDGNLLPDDVRLTSFGKKLRSASIDELPELFNILKGGLTGLAQVKGRNAISWEERFRWDVSYVRKLSLRMDLFILFESVRVVLKQEGIHSETSETMEDFKGSYKEKLS